VEGEVDPVRDFDIISEELRLKDEETLMKSLDKLEKTVGRGNDKKVKPEFVSIAFLLTIRETFISDQCDHFRIRVVKFKKTNRQNFSSLAPRTDDDDDL
jgi:obg-like ATPase 1